MDWKAEAIRLESLIELKMVEVVQVLVLLGQKLRTLRPPQREDWIQRGGRCTPG